MEKSVRPAARPARASLGQRFAASIPSASTSIPALRPALVRPNRHNRLRNRHNLRRGVLRDGVPLPVPRLVVPVSLLPALSPSNTAIFKAKTRPFMPTLARFTVRRTTSGLPSRPRASKFRSHVIEFRICRKWNGRCLSAWKLARNGQTRKSGKS